MVGFANSNSVFSVISFVDQSQRESVSSVFRLLANAEAVDAS